MHCDMHPLPAAYYIRGQIPLITSDNIQKIQQSILNSFKMLCCYYTAGIDIRYGIRTLLAGSIF